MVSRSLAACWSTGPLCMEALIIDHVIILHCMFVTSACAKLHSKLPLYQITLHTNVVNILLNSDFNPSPPPINLIKEVSDMLQHIISSCRVEILYSYSCNPVLQLSNPSIKCKCFTQIFYNHVFLLKETAAVFLRQVNAWQPSVSSVLPTTIHCKQSVHRTVTHFKLAFR